jgi:hydroxymethylbilane synthase
MRSLIKVAARDSLLSRAQVAEVAREYGLEFETHFVKTTGDLDKKTSLRTLDKPDFFTKEVDALVLNGTCDLAIHSAKDLPERLPEGLRLVALTKGLAPYDALVLREGEQLKEGAVVATSSVRREEAVNMLGVPVTFTDIRGTIEERLEKLHKKEVDAVVIAEAALIRLGLNPNRLMLPGETAPLQGRLALVARLDYLFFFAGAEV